MKFEIVTHNHNYPRLLAWQLSSLILYPSPGHQFTYTLYHEPNDAPVLNVVEFFRPKLPHNVQIRLRPQPVEMLRNRANGRNEAAKGTDADWVWFADTDYVFLRNCWTDLYQQLQARPGTRFAAPLDIWETDWPKGDSMISEMDTLAVRDVDVSGIPRVYKHIAIGGLQIAHGPTVREIGYCPWLVGTRDQWDFKSDMKFRRQKELEPRIEVKLDAVLRIRHSQRGYGDSNWQEVRN